MTTGTLPFEVDEAKLAPPVFRPASVAKTDTIEQFLASAAPFAAVVAPAGYGKTTLLARCAKADPRPFAWVAVDERDDDALVMLRSVAAAIHRVEPLASSVFEALSGPGDSIWSRVPRLGNAIAALTRPLVVALDDLHRIKNPASLEVLAGLFDYVPPGSKVVITSREEPGLPLARWRARGLLHEIGAAELRLDSREADVLLRGANVALEPSHVVELTEQTEGWPAGLYLAALSIRSGAPDSGAIRGFSGDNRYVADYFRFEVLSRMPTAEADFMMRTSVLDTMNGPLCDAVLETTGSATMLESLERSNSFVVALDSRGEQYRYHHLFRQLLQAELTRTAPDAAVELNRRAMVWCIANDRIEASLHYGHAAGERDIVAGLIDQIGIPTYYDGRLETFNEWLGWFDGDQLKEFPGLAVYLAWLRAMIGRSAEAEHYLAVAKGRTSRIPLSDGSATIDPWIATARALTMPDGVERAREDADFALAHLPPDSGWRPSALGMRGIASALLGSIDDATADLLAMAHLARSFGGTDDVFVPLAELAFLDMQRGDWLQAARRMEEARTLVDPRGLGGYSLSALVDVAVARIALHARRYPDARAAMTRAHRLRPLLGDAIPWLALQVAVELGRGHLALGETDAARAMLDEATAVLGRRPNMGTLVEDVADLRARVAAASSSMGAWGITLTTAELRLLPYLATHLTVPDIASRLFVTSHTVRSEAKSIYRKLDASSRTEAVERAVDIGLLEPMFPHRSSVAV